MRTKYEHFKVTTYGELDDGDIFVAVFEQTFVARCLKAFSPGTDGATPMFAILGPFMPNRGNVPTLHQSTNLGREVIDISEECRIVPDVGPYSLMAQMPESSKAAGTMVLVRGKDEDQQADRALFAVRYPASRGTTPLYVDIRSGQVLGADAVDWNERLTLGRWWIESRRDYDWVREFSYPDIGERHAFSGAQLLPEHI